MRRGVVGAIAVALLVVGGAVAVLVAHREDVPLETADAPEPPRPSRPLATVALADEHSVVLQPMERDVAEVRRLDADGNVVWAVAIARPCSPTLVVVGDLALVGDCDDVEGGQRPHLVAIALATGATVWRTDDASIEPTLAGPRRTYGVLGDDDALLEIEAEDRAVELRVRDRATGRVRVAARGPELDYFDLTLRMSGGRPYLDRSDGAVIYLFDPITAATSPIAPTDATAVCMTERSVIYRQPDGSVLERADGATEGRWIAWVREGSIGCAVDGDRLYLGWRSPNFGGEENPHRGIETTPLASASVTVEGEGALLRYERGVLSWGVVTAWGELDVLSPPTDAEPPPHLRRDAAGRLVGRISSPSLWFEEVGEVGGREIPIVVDDATGEVSAP